MIVKICFTVLFIDLIVVKSSVMFAIVLGNFSLFSFFFFFFISNALEAIGGNLVQLLKARFHYERGKEHSLSLLLIFD